MNFRKLSKPIALCISILLIAGMASSIAFTAVQAATGTSGSQTFGNAAVGQMTNYFSTDRDASRFQLSQSGTLQSITVYFLTTGFSSKAAIYTDNNAKPSTLIAQSSSQTINGRGWISFTVPQVSLTPGYYWLCVVSSGASAQGTMMATSSNNHAWKTTNYSNEYPSSFGTATGYEQAVNSIYATYIPTSSGSTETSMSSSTPTSNPNNLTPFPTAWEDPSIGGISSGHSIGNQYLGDSNLVLDSSTLYNGNPTIKVGTVGSSRNYARECDGPWFSIKPGDHIVFTAWMKTTASSFGDTTPWSGIRIGIDFYGPKGNIAGTQSPDGSVWTPWSGWPAGQTFVNWGTGTWTKITMDFIVQSQYPAGQYGYAYPAGQMVTPTNIIPWIQVCTNYDQGQAWFADTQLYINP